MTLLSCLRLTLNFRQRGLFRCHSVVVYPLKHEFNNAEDKIINENNI